jgi:hypothetical protein
LAPNSTNATFVALTTGKGGTGKAAQVLYPANPTSTQNSPDWHLYWSPAVAAGKTHYIQMTIKSDGVITSPFAIKFHRLVTAIGGGSTPQWGTHDHLPYAGGSSTATYWQFTDNGFTDDVSAYPTGHDQATQPIGPLLTTLLNDGLWHRFVWQYKAPSSNGATDGIGRAWIDDVLIVNCSSTGQGVTPSGGIKQYCGSDMLTHMLSGSTVTLHDGGPFFGGAQSTIPTTDHVTFSYNIGDGDATNPDTFAWWTD